MDSTFDSVETEIIAFVQQQTAGLEALRSDLNSRLDVHRKTFESSATKLLQRVEQLRKQPAATQVSLWTDAADVAANVTKHEYSAVAASQNTDDIAATMSNQPRSTDKRSTSEATQNADDPGVSLPIQLQCIEANRFECAWQVMKQDARFTDAFLAHNKMQEDNIAVLKNDVLYGCLESTELFAVLCFIAAIAPVPVAVVSPDFFGAHANESQVDKDGIRSHDNIFCIQDDYEVLLMPVFVIDGQEFEHGLGHWIIGIYSRRTGVANIYNPALLGTVSPSTKELIVKAVRTSLPEGMAEPRVECRFQTYGYNKQLDATSCGFFVVLYSELYVFRGEDQMYVIGFDIEDYRRSIVGLVQRLYAEFVTGVESALDESGESNLRIESSMALHACDAASRSVRAAPLYEAPVEHRTDSVPQSFVEEGRLKSRSATVTTYADASSSIIGASKCTWQAEKSIEPVMPSTERETSGQNGRPKAHPSMVISHCFSCTSAFSGPNGTSCQAESGRDSAHSHSFCRMCLIDYFNRTDLSTLRVAQDGGAVGCVRHSCRQFLVCDSLTELLSPDVMIRIREHCEKEMMLQVASVERCKNPKCDYAVEIEAHPGTEPIFLCAKCKAAFCRICKREARGHGPFTCHASDYQDGWSTASSRTRRTPRRDEQPVDNAHLGWRLSLSRWRKK